MAIISEQPGKPALAIQPARRTITSATLQPLCALVDAALIVLASIVSGIGYHLIALGFIGDVDIFARVGLTTALIYVSSVYNAKLYRVSELIREDNRDLQRVLTSWTLAILILSVIMFVLKVGGATSRGAVIGFAVLGGATLVHWRKTLKQALHRAIDAGAIRGRRAVTLGYPAELARFERHDLLSRFGIDEINRIDIPYGPTSDATRAELKTAVDRAIHLARENAAEELILALPWAAGAELKLARKELRATPLPVRLLPDGNVSAILTDQTAGAARSLFIEIQRAPLTRAEQLTKRMLDIVMAAALIVVLAPLMILAALVIKLEQRGPVIFKQRRKGFNGREFVIYKFRTMTVDEDGAAVVQATKGDQRITRVGRLLRQSSIDELPQLVNVLKGDMSIVGPRPHAVAHDNEYGEMIAKYAYRHHVKPGMTGWAQVNGYRGGTPKIEDMAKRIELDLWYIDNWSTTLDLKILLLTCFEVFRRRNAY